MAIVRGEMTLKVKLTIGGMEISCPEVPYDVLTTGDVLFIPELERRLSRLTGMAVRIETESA